MIPAIIMEHSVHECRLLVGTARTLGTTRSSNRLNTETADRTMRAENIVPDDGSTNSCVFPAPVLTVVVVVIEASAISTSTVVVWLLSYASSSAFSQSSLEPQLKMARQSRTPSSSRTGAPGPLTLGSHLQIEGLVITTSASRSDV